MVAVSLLCSAARPAFADGALLTGDELFAGVLKLLALAALVITVVVVGVKLLVRSLRAAADRERAAKLAGPVVPAARVVNDRDKPP